MKNTVIIIAAAMVVAALLSGCTVNVKIQSAQEMQENAVAVPEADEEPTLRECVASDEGLGTEATVGACINSLDVHDEKFMELVTKNLNTVTLENELKPDALFSYNIDKCPQDGIHEEEIGGKRISVPALDHSRADAILDVIRDWNDAHPEREIKVRGHVLVWHSQTPEWFFHEDYDATTDYVSAEEMNCRMEWYIKSVLTYYTGSDSKYRDMFYGWDVVNEAVSDRTGTYRTDTEHGDDKLSDPVHGSKSSWWKVYGSNQYIINAFRYANAYAPDDLKLYYNDYNECDSKKMKGILSLIADVKAAEGTRLDGFGMQGHYTVFAPTADKIAEAAGQYAEAAGSVMLTELDVKPSMLYNGTKEALPEEYERQGKYYRSIYDALIKLHEDGVNVTGITFWGLSDKYTWLAGTHPLLFDEDYNPKPAYYAFTGIEK